MSILPACNQHVGRVVIERGCRVAFARVGHVRASDECAGAVVEGLGRLRDVSRIEATCHQDPGKSGDVDTPCCVAVPGIIHRIGREREYIIGRVEDFRAAQWSAIGGLTSRDQNEMRDIRSR